MFQSIAINLAPNDIFPTFYTEKDEDGITPQTRALFFCMVATGTERIFTHDDCREFVFRLAVMFRQMDVIDNFFKDDYLFDFPFGEHHYRVSSDDLLAHVGLYATDYPDHAMPRGEWFGNMQRCWESAIWVSILGGGINPLAHLVFEEKPEKHIHVKMKSLDVQPTPEHIQNAAIMAKNVMKEIPVEPFARFCEKEKDSLQKIEEYLVFARSPLPIQYDWDAIPSENQQAILKHLVEEQFYFEGMTMGEVIDEYADWVPDLVYLAWIKANGFAKDLYCDEVDPRVDIDPSKYEELGVDGGINLGVTYDSFDLYEIEKYLVHENPDVSQQRIQHEES